MNLECISKGVKGIERESFHLFRRFNRFSLAYLEPPQLRRLYVRTVYHGYEEYESSLFSSFMKGDMVVLDIGAAWGHYSIIAAKLIGERGRVYAFEPDPLVYRSLVKNIKANHLNNVIPLPYAVSNKLQETRLAITGVIGGQSIYADRTKKGKYAMVKTIRLDDFKEIERVDVIRMDIDGGELFALFGMSRLLENSEQLKIFVEFAPSFQRQSGVDPIALIDYLKSKQFSIHNINTRNQSLDLADRDFFLRNHDQVTNLFCER